MFDEVIGRILGAIDEKEILTETYPKFSGEGYRAHRIDIKNFHEIKKTASGKKIAFIDGGSAEIIGSANFSLNLIRVCCVVYKNNKKIAAKRFEILAFVKAVNEEGEIYFKTEIFNLNSSLKLDEASFNSLDHTLMHGINRAEISNVANAVRRFAELRLAKHASDSHFSDFIVLDGNLQSTLTNENHYLNELYESCEKNNAVLGALSKTNSIFTENGDLLSAVLLGISKMDSWIYYPIADIENHSHKAEMFFVKFHEKSRHIFRLEIFNAQKTMAEQVINELAGNCADPIFIGYPYGLIEADRTARVSNNEKESLRTMLLVKLKNRNIEKYLSAANAHE
ncbi:DNA double-strand break repair nuclease NurA, partial [Candidatus Woesearchaeota archaeon]|nr:DNA double-strand break repair nuclease NurA [Candidatus Woesearchaeota archaeon]